MKYLAFVIVLLMNTINASAQTWDWDWEKVAGGSANEEIGGQSVSDLPGNTYVVGSFSSPVAVFGTFSLTLTGTRNMFIAKYNSLGNVMWVKTSAACNDSRAFAVALDPMAAGLYVAGTYSGPSITFGAFTLNNTGNGGMYVVKYDNSGNVVWAQDAAETGTAAAYGIAADVWGNCYVTGEYNGPTIGFGATTLTNLGLDSFDMFLVKYNSAGNVVWAKNGGGNSFDGGKGVSIGSSGAGSVYATGYFASTTAAFGTASLTNGTSSPNTFLVKYDTSGNAVWARKSIGNTGRNGNWIAAGIDPLEDVYVSGSFTGTNVKFDTATLTNANAATSDAFLVHYDSSGVLKHAMRIGGNGNEVAGVTIDQNFVGHTFLTGYYTSDSIAADTFMFHNAMTNGTSDIFTIGFDDQWNSFFGKTAGGPNNDYALSCNVHGIGDMYIAGAFTDHYMYFDTDTAENHAINGSGDIFVAKLSIVTAGIAQLNSSNTALLIYPNPAKSEVNIQLKGKGYTELTVSDLFGRNVYMRKLDADDRDQLCDIPLNIPSGMYLVRAKGINSFSVQKLIVE